MLACVKQMAKNYPCRKTYQELKERFENFMPPFMREQTTDDKRFVEVLLLATNCDQGDYVLGESMVFFRAASGGELLRGSHPLPTASCALISLTAACMHLYVCCRRAA